MSDETPKVVPFVRRPDPDSEENQANIIETLENFLTKAHAGELVAVAVCAVYADTDENFSSSEFAARDTASMAALSTSVRLLDNRILGAL